MIGPLSGQGIYGKCLGSRNLDNSAASGRGNSDPARKRSRPRLNPAQIVGVEGERRIITELNSDDVTNVIAEDVNDFADRVRAEWPWLFLYHLIANVKIRCGHRTCSERFKCRRRPK